MSLLDSALGVHAQALAVRSQRVEVLARNIANADTPQYKAQDLDFKQVLKSAQSGDLQTTNSKHLSELAAGHRRRFEIPHPLQRRVRRQHRRTERGTSPIR